MIMVSGPTSAESEEVRPERLKELNRAAAEVLRRGHTPLVGVNAAGPVVEQAEVGDRYEAIILICEALAERCDAVLLVGESGGACREVEVFECRGRPVYRAVEEIPAGPAKRACDEGKGVRGRWTRSSPEVWASTASFGLSFSLNQTPRYGMCSYLFW